MSWAKIAPIFKGAVGGAIVITIAGFSWLGWVTGGTAQQEATEMADAAVNDRLAKICVYQFGLDPGKDLKLKELQGRSSWMRSDYLKEQGWSTMPGEEEPDRGVTEKCTKLLMEISQ